VKILIWKTGILLAGFCPISMLCMLEAEMFTCREARRDPDNIDRLASSLVEHLNHDQEDTIFEPPTEQNLKS
jgi:hypothetical protein